MFSQCSRRRAARIHSIATNPSLPTQVVEEVLKNPTAHLAWMAKIAAMAEHDSNVAKYIAVCKKYDLPLDARILTRQPEEWAIIMATYCGPNPSFDSDSCDDDSK